MKSVAFVSLILMAAAGCGGDKPLDSCTPGAVAICQCPGGHASTRICNQAGTPGTCACGGDASVASDGAPPGGDGGTDAADGSPGDLSAPTGDAAADGGGDGAPGADHGTGDGSHDRDSGDDGATEAGDPDSDGGLGGSRRLPFPCTAPVPTGFCLQSEAGDFIGGGKNTTAGGATTVRISSGSSTSTNSVSLTLQDTGSSRSWNLDLAAPKGTPLVPGLYNPAERYPFQQAIAGLDVDGNGVGCNTLTGKFSIEEMARDPVSGINRFSATFEQHCDGATPALRGVVNFQASGVADPTLGPSRTIALSGKIFRVAYDPVANIAYGMDAANRRLARIDLAAGKATYADIVQVPNDGCVDAKRGRLFVVNKGSSLITEYGTSDLKAVRDIAWTGKDWGESTTHYKIYCGPDKLYVVDGAWAPGLFTVSGLDGAAPAATDQTTLVSGVGGLVLNAAATDLYFWYQYGWSAGVLSTSVKRLTAATLAMVDQTASTVPSFTRDPLDAPILLDEARSLVFAKNKIFDATNLTKVIFSLPSTFDSFNGAAENAYALDAKRGLMATRNYVYELDRFGIVAPTITGAADQMFFDASGTLWFLSVSAGALQAQTVTR
jgi:hypothetical protein